MGKGAIDANGRWESGQGRRRRRACASERACMVTESPRRALTLVAGTRTCLCVLWEARPAACSGTTASWFLSLEKTGASVSSTSCCGERPDASSNRVVAAESSESPTGVPLS
eukprot:6214458-Pleurochrysis_carterae.AAC.8